jgi:hypothetical protein
MRVSLYRSIFLLTAQLGSGSLTPTIIDLKTRLEDTTDDLDQWLADAQRVSPDALRACPASCSTVSANDSELDS